MERKGWYPGKFLGSLRSSRISTKDVNELLAAIEAEIKEPFIAIVTDPTDKVIDWWTAYNTSDAVEKRDRMMAKFPKAVNGYVYELKAINHPELSTKK